MRYFVNSIIFRVSNRLLYCVFVKVNFEKLKKKMPEIFIFSMPSMFQHWLNLLILFRIRYKKILYLSNVPYSKWTSKVRAISYSGTRFDQTMQKKVTFGFWSLVVRQTTRSLFRVVRWIFWLSRAAISNAEPDSLV